MGASLGPSIVDNGLVLCVDMADTNSYISGSSIIYDLVGNTGNNMNLINNPIFEASNAGCLVFNGINNRAGSVNHLAFNTSATWEAWINRTSSIGSHNMFMGRFLPYFSFRSSNVFWFSNNIGGTQRSLQTTNSSFQNNVWYHTAFTSLYNGVDTIMNIYINGVLQGLTSSNSFSGFQNNASYSVYEFTIGDGGDSNTWFPFNGKVAGVKIYNRTLSSSEILNNFNTTKTRFGYS